MCGKHSGRRLRINKRSTSPRRRDPPPQCCHGRRLPACWPSNRSTWAEGIAKSGGRIGTARIGTRKRNMRRKIPDDSKPISLPAGQSQDCTGDEHSVFRNDPGPTSFTPSRRRSPEKSTRSNSPIDAALPRNALIPLGKLHFRVPLASRVDAFSHVRGIRHHESTQAGDPLQVVTTSQHRVTGLSVVAPIPVRRLLGNPGVRNLLG